MEMFSNRRFDRPVTIVLRPWTYLNELSLELKIEIVIHLNNPTLLARCSRGWHNIINLPSTKSRWLIRRYGRTHALFHAVRMGEPFINLAVVESLLVQNAHISRYFIQRLVLGFGSHDRRLIELQSAHKTGPFGSNRKKSIQNKIQSPWASNLPFDIFSRLLKEGHDRFEGNDIPVRGNDMESFYYLSACSLPINQARTKLMETKNDIKRLIRTFKFAPFPPRPKVRKHVLEKKEDGKIGLRPYSDTESKLRTANNDEYPALDGYEDVGQLNVIARAILIYPKLVKVWKEIGYHEIVNDVNDLVIQGSLLILYPPNPSEHWVKPSLQQVVEKLNSLISLGFELTDALIGDALISFEHRLHDIGETLLSAFAVVRCVNRREIISIGLTELLNPDRGLTGHDSLDFILNQIENSEAEILSVFKKYEIVRSVDEYRSAFTKHKLGKHTTRSRPILLPFTRLKYKPIMYRYIIRFGAQSKVASYLMKEVTAVRIAITLMEEISARQRSSDSRWPDSITIFNEYYKANVPLKATFLCLFGKCQDNSVIKSLFEAYLADLFGLKVEYQIPVLSTVTPFMQGVFQNRKKAKLRLKWRSELLSYHLENKEPNNYTFKEALHKFIQRIVESMQEEDAAGTSSMRI